MPIVSRDTAFLARPRWIGKLTVVVVPDGWMRQQVINVAAGHPDYDRQDLEVGCHPNTVNHAAAVLPLIGQPLVVAHPDPKIKEPKLAEWLKALADVARNPTLVVLPHATGLPELFKDTKDKTPWQIIRQTDLAKKPERIALTDRITATFKPPVKIAEEWQELATEWFKQQQEASPTSLRLALDFTHAIATDDKGNLDPIRAKEAIATDDNSRKFPEVLAHMVAMVRAPGQRSMLLLLQQIAANTQDDDSTRALAAVIELTAVQLATCTNQIPQPEDPKVHAYVRQLINEQGNLTPAQVIKASLMAQQLAFAIRTSANPLADCTAILSPLAA